MEKYKAETVAQQAPQQTEISVLKSVNRISMFVGIIVAWAMWMDGHSVTASMLAGVGFYLVVAVLLITAPFLTAIIIAWQREVTIRRYNALPYEMAQDAQKSFQVVDQPRIGYEPTTAPLRLPETPSFVPAVPRISDNTKIDAANFINHLFDGDGRPLPSKITRNKGQIQHKSPSPEAVEYMASLGIVRAGEGNQLYFDLTTYPTHRDALNTVRTGVKPSVWQGGKEEGTASQLLPLESGELVSGATRYSGHPRP